MEGVEPRLVYKTSRSRKGKHRRKDKPVMVQRWEQCDPAAIRATREIYMRWHAGMLRLIYMLGDELLQFKINGFAAPERPWEMPLQNSA